MTSAGDRSTMDATRDPLHHRTTCRLCGSARVEVVLPLAPTPIADAYVTAAEREKSQPLYPLDVYLCRDCGHVQLLDVIDPGILFSNYIYQTSVSPGLTDHFERYAADVIARFAPPKNSLVVDIGSNEGTLLGFFKRNGQRVLGVDPAQRIAAQATAAGIETIPTFFSSDLAARLLEERGPASIITANNVFAHADDLMDIARGVRVLLAPDGVFIFEVSYLVDQLDNMVFDYVYHEHLCYHSVVPLRDFFRRVGLELVDVQRIPTKGGSIRGFARRADAKPAVSASVGEFVADEERRELADPRTYREFMRKIEREKSALRARVSQWRKEGKRLCGYGASATVTTLLYHFELGDDLDFLVDDDPIRHHRFSPGKHLPILPSSELYTRRPDVVIILAWRYADAIMKRHREYLAQGGHFVVPLPHLTVV